MSDRENGNAEESNAEEQRVEINARRHTYCKRQAVAVSLLEGVFGGAIVFAAVQVIGKRFPYAQKYYSTIFPIFVGWLTYASSLKPNYNRCRLSWMNVDREQPQERCQGRPEQQDQVLQDTAPEVKDNCTVFRDA